MNLLNSGCYILILDLVRNKKITVGSLGEIMFMQGKYAYIGSGMDCLEQRIKRHIRLNEIKVNSKKHKKHWHIDYILMDNDFSIENILIRRSLSKEECEIAETVSRDNETIHGFGSTDCRCHGHLFRINRLSSCGMKQFNLFEKSEKSGP